MDIRYDTAHWQMAMRVVSYLSRLKEMGLRLRGTQKTSHSKAGSMRITVVTSTQDDRLLVMSSKSEVRSWIGTPNARRPSHAYPGVRFALSESTGEARWLRSLLTELDFG